MIDKVFDVFTSMFFDPNSEDDQEKLDELKVEVQGSQLPSELRKVLTFKIRMFVDLMRFKKENPASVYPIFPRIFRLF